MVNRKSFYYQIAKRISTIKNISAPSWRTSTIQELKDYIISNRLTFLNDLINRDVIQFEYRNQTPENLRNQLLLLFEANQIYYINFVDINNNPILINGLRELSSNSVISKFYEIQAILEKLLTNSNDYGIDYYKINLQFHKVVDVNPPLRQQRDGEINCGIDAVLKHIKSKKPTINTKTRIKKLEKLNEEYFEKGLDDKGLQKLADLSQLTIVVKDKIGEIWREFISNNKNSKKIILISSRTHLQNEILNDDDDDDDDETKEKYCIELDYQNKLCDKKFVDKAICWFDDNQPIIDIANEYELQGNLDGVPIISKGELQAYITNDKIYKTKFYQYENYQECFTSGGVGKARFVEQMINKGLDHYQYGIDDSDPFYKLLMEADRSGFYCRTEESSEKNFKYDMNKAYKSFDKSNIFKGFPIFEAVFDVNKLFSDSGLSGNGLLYIEWDTLTVDKLYKKLYYEGSGFYPIEIVKYYYDNYGINPFVKSYAYGSQNFNVDFSKYTNDQFRTFLGKCISQSYEEVWQTDNYLEFMRSRYILKDRIISISCSNNIYKIVFKSDKKPWNFPVLSVYIKSHQKFNLFQQYNKLIDNNIVPVAVNVDGIEVKEKCDELFSIGCRNGQYKYEKIIVRPAENTVITREIYQPPKGNGEFIKLPKFLHISGAGGNGKSEYIVKLAKSYKSLCFIGPTNIACNNLIERGKSLGIKIDAFTYHKVFGISCRDMFPRHKYNRFVLDECSMVSAQALKMIMDKLNPTQSLLLAGDFNQLPPAGGEGGIFNNWTGEKSLEYERFNIMELTKNWRQKEDPDFFELCNKLRTKLSKTDAMEIIEKLNTRFIKIKKSDINTIDDIYICGINKQVDTINTSSLKCNRVVSIKNFKDGDNFISNGLIGIVKKQNKNNIIKWENGTESNYQKCESRINPATAITVHKSQGKTLKRNVVIDPTRLFSKNHLYVALTRATKFSNIYLTKKITFDIFSKTVQVLNDLSSSNNSDE